MNHILMLYLCCLWSSWCVLFFNAFTSHLSWCVIYHIDISTYTKSIFSWAIDVYV